jgi:cytochrome c-type biogenesis protein CcmH
MKKFVYPLMLVIVMGLINTSFAAIDALQFKDQAQEERYRKLAMELRCLVCQNQSLADSNADLARDLRIEVLRLMNGGKSDKEITEYLVARYGDFVRYRPPLNAVTLMLWAGPAILFVLAVFGLARVIRARRSNSEDETLSADDSRRIQKLLQEKDS